MVLTWIWTVFTSAAAVFAIILGRGSAVTGAALEGAKSGIELTIAIAGPLCLWSGVGKLMEQLGLTHTLAKLLAPVLHRLLQKHVLFSYLRKGAEFAELLCILLLLNAEAEFFYQGLRRCMNRKP